jgi:hypothetical protein
MLCRVNISRRQTEIELICNAAPDVHPSQELVVVKADTVTKVHNVV